MRRIEPHRPSIASVLTQAQVYPWVQPKRHARRRRHPRSTPHRPRYPPQLDEDYLMKTVDYRDSAPPCPQPRSSFALAPALFDDASVLDIAPYKEPTTATTTDENATAPTVAATAGARSKKVKTICAHVVNLIHAVSLKCRGLRRVKRVGRGSNFDLDA